MSPRNVSFQKKKRRKKNICSFQAPFCMCPSIYEATTTQHEHCLNTSCVEFTSISTKNCVHCSSENRNTQIWFYFSFVLNKNVAFQLLIISSTILQQIDWLFSSSNRIPKILRKNKIKKCITKINKNTTKLPYVFEQFLCMWMWLKMVQLKFEQIIENSFDE